MKKTNNGCNCPVTGLPVSTILLGIILIGGAILGTCLYNKVNEIHKATIEMSFGSSANFHKFFDARMTPENKQQIDEAISKEVETLKNAPTQTADVDETPTTPSANATLSTEEITALLGTTPTLNNKQGEILVIEYADFLCGYCKRFHDEKTLKTLADNHDNVAIAIKAIPLFGAKSQPAAYGAYCAAQIGGEASYYAYLDQAFEAQATSNDGAKAIASTIGLDAAAFESCLSDAATKTTVDAVFPGATQKFGISGTPASVLINTTTGKYEVVGGAYPLSEFEAALERVK